MSGLSTKTEVKYQPITHAVNQKDFYFAPTASKPTGGLQILFATKNRTKNCSRIIVVQHLYLHI